MGAHCNFKIVEPENISTGGKKIGEEITPMKIFVRRIVRPKYALGDVGESKIGRSMTVGDVDDLGDLSDLDQHSGVVIAELPCFQASGYRQKKLPLCRKPQSSTKRRNDVLLFRNM